MDNISYVRTTVIIIAVFLYCIRKVGVMPSGGPDNCDAQSVTIGSPSTVARVRSAWRMRYEITEAREPSVVGIIQWGPGESQNRKPSQRQLMDNRRDMRETPVS